MIIYPQLVDDIWQLNPIRNYLLYISIFDWLLFKFNILELVKPTKKRFHMFLKCPWHENLNNSRQGIFTEDSFYFFDIYRLCSTHISSVRDIFLNFHKIFNADGIPFLSLVHIRLLCALYIHVEETRYFCTTQRASIYTHLTKVCVTRTYDMFDKILDIMCMWYGYFLFDLYF